MTSSATPPTRPQVEPIKKFLTILFSYSKWRTNCRVFPDTSSPFLDSSLESSVLESEAEDSGKETANPECKSSDGQWRESPKAKTNGKCKLASTKSLNISLRTVGGFISVGFSLTKRLRMWIANYGNDFRIRLE